jgi:hypothetical protein
VIVTLGDVQVARGVELNLVRHVQGRLRCGSSVAAVRLLAVAGNGGNPTRLEIESPDALIVEVTKVQRTVGPDD